jgi:hypothetical protein
VGGEGGSVGLLGVDGRYYCASEILLAYLDISLNSYAIVITLALFTDNIQQELFSSYISELSVEKKNKIQISCVSYLISPL